MLTRLPLSLMVELAVDCSTKYSVPSALMKSGGGFSSAMLVLVDQRELAGRVRTGQGGERSGGIGKPERLRHRHDQFPFLGEVQDPATGPGPERAASRVGRADEDVSV